MTLDARRKRQAREHAAAIDQHRTGAALSLVAALLAAGQPQMLPQRVEQGGAHIERDTMLPLIDFEKEAHRIARQARVRVPSVRLRVRRTAKRRHNCGRSGDHEEVPSAVSLRPVRLAITLAHGRAPHSHVLKGIGGRTSALLNRSAGAQNVRHFALTSADPSAWQQDPTATRTDGPINHSGSKSCEKTPTSTIGLMTRGSLF